MTQLSSHYRPPAWGGLTPAPVSFVPVAEGIEKKITQCLGGGQVFTLAGAYENKFFKFVPDHPTDASALFLKIIPTKHVADLKSAEEIGKWLRNNGVSAMSQISKSPFDLDHENVIFAYPFIESRFLKPTKKDAQELGFLLGHFHREISNYPNIIEWQKATRNRALHLSEVAHNFTATPLDIKLPLSAQQISKAFLDGGTDFLWDSHKATAGHGDLNIFNVIADKNNGQLHLLDFEDCIHSVLPPVFDVSNAALRMLILQEEDDHKARALLLEFIHTYEISSNNQIHLSDIPLAIKAMASRSICILLDCAFNNIEIEPSEWEKFPALIEYVNTRDAIFRSE